MSEVRVWDGFWLWYFDPKSFEKAGDCRLYRLLGVRRFKRYLPTSGDLVTRWQGITRIQQARGGLDHALRRHERVTRSYEARHIFGALSMLAISWWSITFHDKGQWPALIAANGLINGYPIMLQRYNRIRLKARSPTTPVSANAARPTGHWPPTAHDRTPPGGALAVVPDMGEDAADDHDTD